MTIFVDRSGRPTTAFPNLQTISGNDPGLDLVDVPTDTTAFEITYAETAGQPATADRLNTLVNTDFGTPIVITALNGGNDPYIGGDITGNGQTYVDSTSGSDIVRVVYDVSQGCGAGIALFDTAGNTISAPNPVILYHEFSHAFHFATGNFPFPQTACPGNTSDEPAAEIDENVLRTQLGLCLRDVCNHGGTSGAGNTCGGSDGGPDGGPPAEGCGTSCFTGDTRVTLADGDEKPIELVRTGDLVLGRFGHANRVVGIDRPLLGNRRLYALNGSKPFVTAEHPFMTTAGWKAIDPQATAAENPLLIVGRLAVDDRLLKLARCAVTAGAYASDEEVEAVFETTRLISLEQRRADPDTPLYNLFLDGDHSYFANGYLVHNKCFIVTAATGSAQSEEVTELRALRDRVAAAAPLAGQLIDAIYAEYWRFSPAIAEQIKSSETARVGVMALVVRPLFAWYQLAGQLALNPADTEAIKHAEAELAAACPRYLGPSRIASYWILLANGEPLPASAPELAQRLAPKLGQGLALPLARWAIFEPLVRTWSGAAARLDMKREVADWLGLAPVDALPPPPPEHMERDLATLAALFAFDEGARRQLGERLHTAWPSAANALRRARMLDVAS